MFDRYDGEIQINQTILTKQKILELKSYPKGFTNVICMKAKSISFDKKNQLFGFLQEIQWPSVSLVTFEHVLENIYMINMIYWK